MSSKIKELRSIVFDSDKYVLCTYLINTETIHNYFLYSYSLVLILQAEKVRNRGFSPELALHVKFETNRQSSYLLINWNLFDNLVSCFEANSHFGCIILEHVELLNISHIWISKWYFSVIYSIWEKKLVIRTWEKFPMMF